MCRTHTLEEKPKKKEEKKNRINMLFHNSTAADDRVYCLAFKFFLYVSFKVCTSASFHQGCCHCKHRLTGCTEPSAVPGSKPSDLPRKQLNDKLSQACRKKILTNCTLLVNLYMSLYSTTETTGIIQFKKTKPGVRNNKNIIT